MFPQCIVPQSCVSILLLVLMLICIHHLQPGKKLVWYNTSSLCFLIETYLTSNPGSFYFLSDITCSKHEIALTGWIYINLCKKEKKGGCMGEE